MKQLVEVKNGNVICDSRDVAEKFKVKHVAAARVIESFIKRLEKIKGDPKTPLITFEGYEKNNPLFIKKQEEYRGQKFTAYQMNKKAFILVAMKFKTDAAIIWQMNFVDAFEAMEDRLIAEESNKKNATWVGQREQGKLVRLTAMDTVKDFTEYAKSQGSQNAQFYYKHITQACYKCLQLIEAKRPKLRDTLDLFQLSQLMVAEVVAERSIRKHMAEGEHYKTIFTLVKQDLERFADGLMIPNSGQQKRLEGK